MNKSTEIRMTINNEDLRNIYFQGGNHRIFFGPKTWKESIILSLATFTFPFYMVYEYQKNNGLALFVGIVLFGLAIYAFARQAIPIIKWKKSVNDFIDDLRDIADIRFVYNENFFVHYQADKISKQEWSTVIRAVITQQCIWLFSETNVLLPKSSMSEKEFLQLRNNVFECVKNVQIT